MQIQVGFANRQDLTQSFGEVLVFGCLTGPGFLARAIGLHRNMCTQTPA